MITRIRTVGIKPGTLSKYQEVCREWSSLIHKYGGRVLGFYLDAAENTVTGIAEYASREQLAEVQKRCEADSKFASISRRAEEVMTSFEERILDKLKLE